MDAGILLTGILVFVARIIDVAMGILRTMMAIQGRMLIAFLLGFVEVIIWVLVVSTVVSQIRQSPALILFYALGFACGNVVGILVEGKLALGNIALNVISTQEGDALAETLRAAGQPVTVFAGMGMSGPVAQLFMVCRRRDIKRLLAIVQEVDAGALVITDMVQGINKSPHRFHRKGISPFRRPSAPSLAKEETPAPLPQSGGECEHEQSA